MPECIFLFDNRSLIGITGDCDMAICGGTNYMGTPGLFVQLSKSAMISPEGLSKAFSAKADGYARAEGCGIVVLKRLKDVSISTNVSNRHKKKTFYFPDTAKNHLFHSSSWTRAVSMI